MKKLGLILTMIGIFFIQHISMRKGASFFLPGSEGVKLHKRFDLSDGTVVKKTLSKQFSRNFFTGAISKQENKKSRHLWRDESYVC